MILYNKGIQIKRVNRTYKGFIRQFYTTDEINQMLRWLKAKDTTRMSNCPLVCKALGYMTQKEKEQENQNDII